MFRLDKKLANIRNGRYKRSDFMIADAKDGDMAFGVTPAGPRGGDTPSGIAEKTGVPLATLQRLNPRLDPQTLSPGQKIRLRR